MYDTGFGFTGYDVADNIKLVLGERKLDCLKNGKSDEEILRMIKNKFWHGYIKAIYPEDAVNLNTSIMIQLIKKDFF